ncbi:hypothetical protein [Cellulomonas endophytica]|uniref:hypothetical protein n=1 Tax=Cellulomonas endophytica TaxID=2494735 RepID=UPI0010109307|nr:hypothetical protein [Cellulomonas endophytica]
MAGSTREDVEEYDRFGPWVDEVRTAAQVPRLFRDHGLDPAAARLVLKVPRGIARRDAHVGMDLYDHLLAVDDERLTVLSRHDGTPVRRRGAPGPGGYTVQVLPLDEVVATGDVVSLLDGTLSVHATGGRTVVVRYNGAARAAVTRLVDEVRAAASHRSPSAAGWALLHAARAGGPVPALRLGRDDQALVSGARDLLRHHGDLVPWALHGRVPLVPDAFGPAGTAHRLGHLLQPMTLHGAVLAGDDTALEVVARHAWLLRGRHPVHSVARFVLPLHALAGTDVQPHPLYPAVTVVAWRAGGGSAELVVPTGSRAHALLAAAGA